MNTYLFFIEFCFPNRKDLTNASLLIESDKTDIEEIEKDVEHILKKLVKELSNTDEFYYLILGYISAKNSKITHNHIPKYQCLSNWIWYDKSINKYILTSFVKPNWNIMNALNKEKKLNVFTFGKNLLSYDELREKIIYKLKYIYKIENITFGSTDFNYEFFDKLIHKNYKNDYVFLFFDLNDFHTIKEILKLKSFYPTIDIIYYLDDSNSYHIENRPNNNIIFKKGSVI